MPVYLFTFHAYRSWNADRQQGFVQLNRGLQDPNDHLAKYYDLAAKDTHLLFRAAHQRILLWAAYDAGQKRDCLLHYAAIDPTHVHLLVSWKDEREWDEISPRIKNVCSLLLGRKLKSPGRKWFVRRASRKKIFNQQHYDYLVTKYLPRHCGTKWKLGDKRPEEPRVFGGRANLRLPPKAR